MPLVYSSRFFDEVSATYHALMLVFLGAMTGFVLAGDLFNAFVWFELMGAAAYALVGMRVEEPRSVHAALEFGVGQPERAPVQKLTQPANAGLRAEAHKLVAQRLGFD